MIVVICLTQSIHGAVCQCTCCLGNSCNPTYQGSFSLNSCSITSCIDQCRLKYTSCPTAGSSGSAQGVCTSVAYAPQQKANIILITIFFSVFAVFKMHM